MSSTIFCFNVWPCAYARALACCLNSSSISIVKRLIIAFIFPPIREKYTIIDKVVKIYYLGNRPGPGARDLINFGFLEQLKKEVDKIVNSWYAFIRYAGRRTQKRIEDDEDRQNLNRIGAGTRTAGKI